MPFSFPSSPSVGQQSTQNGRVYAWTGAAWELATSIASHTHSLSDLTQSGATTNQVIAWSGTVWAPAAAATGTVTSVGLSLPAIFSVSGSPVTGSGTLTGALATQAANVVFAGPTTGSAAAPTFRALVSGDLPSHTHDASAITSGRLTSARLPTGAQFTGGADFTGTVTFFGTVQSDSWSITNAGVATLTSVAANLSGSTFGTTADRIITTGTNGALQASATISSSAVSGLGTLATQNGTFSGTSSGVNTGDQTITLTGDVTGSGTGSFAATLANTAVSAGSYGSASQVATFTVDAKGRLTAAGATSIAISSGAVSGLGGAATLNVGTAAGTVAAGDDSRFHTRSHAITSSSDHTATAWRVFYSNGSGVVTELALGSSGQVLTSNGASAAPTFTTPSASGSSVGSDLYLWATFR